MKKFVTYYQKQLQLSVVVVLIVVLLFGSIALSTKEPSLIGSWSIGDVVEGGSEIITLNADGTYQRFLHDRPQDSGTWVAGANIFTLFPDNSQEHEEMYNIVLETRNKMQLTDDKNPNSTEQTWYKVE